MAFLSANTGRQLFNIDLTKDLKKDQKFNKFMLISLKETKSQLVLAISEDEEIPRVQAYPSADVPEHLDLEKEQLYFTSINKETGVLAGYQIAKDWQARKVWQMSLGLGQTESIHQVRSHHQTASDIEHEHYLPTSFVGDNIIYKYLDSNLFAVSTVDHSREELSIYIINGISGKVVYKFHESSVVTKSPIDMVLSENYFILTFYRASQKSASGSGLGAGPSNLPQQELSVTEFYQSREESDTLALLKDFYFGKAARLTQTRFSSFDMEMPVVAQQSYLLTIDVKKIGLTRTMNHVSNKMLVLITTNDQVYTIEHAMFTARRQTKAEAEAAKEREEAKAMSFGKYNLSQEEHIVDVKSPMFPPYDGVIAQRNTRFISYDLHLVDLKNIVAFPTRLESTSAVFSYGHDLFYARINPEGNFDRLHENFKAPLLFGIIAALVIALYASMSYTSSTELKEKFLLSK